MAENNLEAKITLDVTDLKKGLSEAKKAQTDYEKSISETQEAINENRKISAQYEKAIKELTEAHEKSYISTTKYTKALEKLQKDSKETAVETADLTKKLQNLQSGVAAGSQKLGKSMTAQSKATGNANNTLLEFSRVVQDAPYGIQGVGNNITQLVGNFGSLSNAAGGTKGAIKALGASFLGPGGMIFAISTIVSLLTVYGADMLKSADSTAKLKKEIDENNKKLQDYVDTLDKVSRAQLEGKKGSADEMTTLKLLRGQIENTNNSMELRLDGIKNLRKEFPGYFKDISDEQLLNGTATSSYNTLTTAIIKRAKATAATNAIVENAGKEFELADKLKSVQNQITEATKEKTKAEERYQATLKLGGPGQGAGQLAKLGAAQNKLNKLKEEELSVMQQIGTVQLENYDLAKIASENATITPEAEKKAKTPKGKSPRVTQAEKDAETIKKIDAQLFQDQLAAAKEAAKVQGGEVASVLFEETGKLPRPEIYIDVESEEAFRKITDIEKKLDEIKKNFGEGAYNIALNLPTDELDAFRTNLEISKNVADIAATGITDAFGAMSSAITSNSKETDSALSRFVSSLGSSVLKIMATYLSQSVAAAIAGGTASGSATGPGAIVAIPSMIAALIASVLGAFASIPKFAQGGIVPGGSFSGDKIPAMLNSGEMVLNSGQQANLFKALDGSLSSLQGQSNNNPMVASTVIRGEDIYVSWKRTSSNRQRFLG